MIETSEAGVVNHGSIGRIQDVKIRRSPHRSVDSVKHDFIATVGYVRAVVAHFSDTVAVKIDLVGIRGPWTVVIIVGGSIAVDIEIAHVAESIAVEIDLIGIRGPLTVVDVVENSIVVGIREREADQVIKRNQAGIVVPVLKAKLL